jgi:ATP-dependent Lhr-like helicase
LHEAIGGGYPAETVGALWSLVWQGLVTNDTFHALRAFTRESATVKRPRRGAPPVLRSRRLTLPSAEGRWSLVHPERPDHAVRTRAAAATRWAAASAQQLLARHGVLTREAVMAESLPGGFGTVYPVLKAMEESGQLRRGYFVAGLGATQFALPGALDLLRSLRDGNRAEADEREGAECAALAATDPANPYGATLKWPASAAFAASARQAPFAAFAASSGHASVAASSPASLEADAPSPAGRGPTRSVGARVVLVSGGLVAYLARGDRQLLTWLPEAEPERSRAGRAVARALIDLARSGGESPRGMLIEEIDGSPPANHPLAPFLIGAGFLLGAMGLQATFPRAGP